MNLNHLRNQIDTLNLQIIALFAKRAKLSKKIAKIKEKDRLAICDPIREKKQRSLIKKAAKEQGLDPSLVVEIFELLVTYSKDLQGAKRCTKK